MSHVRPIDRHVELIITCRPRRMNRRKEPSGSPAALDSFAAHGEADFGLASRI